MYMQDWPLFVMCNFFLHNFFCFAEPKGIYLGLPLSFLLKNRVQSDPKFN